VGDESVNPFSDFSNALHIAWHEAGLGLVPHVAEQHPRNAIDFLECLPKEALDIKETESRRLRVGHGTLIHMSSALMDEFAEKNICLEVCLSANKRLGLPKETRNINLGEAITSTNGNRTVTMDRMRIDYYNDIKNHPLPVFVKNKIPVCLGSDNPLLMNTNIGKEYSLAVKAGYEEGANILDLTKNGLRFANIPYDVRQKLMNYVSQYEASLAMGKTPVKTVLGYRRAFKALDKDDR
jgi:adenosine deaminase